MGVDSGTIRILGCQQHACCIPLTKHCGVAGTPNFTVTPTIPVEVPYLLDHYLTDPLAGDYHSSVARESLHLGGDLPQDQGWTDNASKVALAVVVILTVAALVGVKVLHLFGVLRQKA